MVDNPQKAPSMRAASTVASAAAATARRAPQARTAAPAAVELDPVTDWLLEREDLDGTELSVLFGIHKLGSRPDRAGWIGHDELCRSTGLGAAELGGVLRRLRRRGLLGMMRHPVRSACARYLLIAQR